jgi:hypothetical protein
MRKRYRSSLALLVAALTGTALLATGGQAFGQAFETDGVTIPEDDGVGPAVESIHHGGTTGHLPPSSENVDLVSRLRLSNIVPEWATDVATYRDTAFVGAWSTKCGTSTPAAQRQPGGFWSIDISDPNNPRELGFTPSPVGSYLTEGLHAFRLTTPSFTGDVLLVSQEICTGVPTGNGGFSLYDVTNPANPVPLVLSRGETHATPFSVEGQTHAAHTAFGWDTGPNAYVAVMDNYDEYDIDIFDITDPRNPRMIRETGLPDWPAEVQAEDDGRGGGPGLHDLIVRRAEGKWLMLASYWDTGYVLLDATNPAAPVFLRDSDFPKPDTLARTPWAEGNAHEAEFDRCPEEGVRSQFPCGDVRYVVAADEDFTPYPIVARIVSGSFNNQEFGGTIAASSRQIGQGDAYAGPTYFAGLACTAASVPAAPAPNAIALVERGTCTFSEKNASVAARGYQMMIVFNSAAAGNCEAANVNMLIDPPATYPAIFVSRSTGYRLMNISGYNPANCPSGANPSPPAVGTRGSDIDIRSQFDGWGYMRLYDFDTFRELDAYAVPEALDPRYASGFGDLSVHEVTTDPTGDVGYVAWYSAGFRVVDYSGGTLEDVGHFIAPEGSNFWGVELNVRRDGRLFALGSDRDYGLYIFRFGTDLQTSLRGTRSMRAGTTTTLSSRVVNDGTIGETATRYTLRLPRGMHALSASASQGRCTVSGRNVTCNLGLLRDDASAQVRVRVHAASAGTKRITAFVNGRKTEYDIGNNDARATVRVRRARAGGNLGGGAGGPGLTGRRP